MVSAHGVCCLSTPSSYGRNRCYLGTDSDIDKSLFFITRKFRVVSQKYKCSQATCSGPQKWFQIVSEFFCSSMMIGHFRVCQLFLWFWYTKSYADDQTTLNNRAWLVLNVRILYLSGGREVRRKVAHQLTSQMSMKLIMFKFNRYL